MENKVLKNIFSQDEIQDIYNCLNGREIQVQDFLGRTRIDYERPEIHMIPESIKNKAQAIADLYFNINGKRYELCYFSFIEYNNKFGVPRLGPHKDQTAFSASALCQINANVDWEIYIEGVPYQLENNSALLANVRDQDHWRPEKELTDDQYVKMLFLHYLDLDDERFNKVTPEQLHETNMRWAHITGYDESEKTY